MPDGEDRPWTRGETVPFAGAVPSPTLPSLWVDSAEWVEEALPQRPWIVRGYLLRGSVTLVSGAGAAGKSMLVVGWAIALALGKGWGRFSPSVPLRSMIFNVEDDAAEQRLRLSAALRQWGMGPAAIGDRIVRAGPEQSGMLLDFDAGSGTVSPTPLMQEIEAAVVQWLPDVVFLDPLVELHSAGENDNTALRAVVAYFRAFAAAHKCAVVLIHHSRKGASQPGDPDSVRGASAVIGAARVVLTMQTMSPEEAEELGIEEERRRDYARVDGAKSNYAPTREAEWFCKQEYLLDNQEWVSALVPWIAPSPNAAPQDVISAILSDIERGTSTGEPWSPKLSSDPRSIRTLLRRHGVTSKKAEAATIEAVETVGVWVCAYRNAHRNLKDGYRTSGGPKCAWVEPRK